MTRYAYTGGTSLVVDTSISTAECPTAPIDFDEDAMRILIDETYGHGGIDWDGLQPADHWRPR